MTRSHCATASAAGLIPFGHLGWAYHDRAEFLCRAAEYIDDGLRLNQRVVFIGGSRAADLRTELAAAPGMREALDAGRIDVGSTAEYYVFRPGTDVIDVDTTLHRLVTTVEDAVAAGFSGFRAVVDVTTMARTPEQRDAQTALEFLSDQKMTVLPFSALCAYDVAELGNSAAEMICVHPHIGEGAVSFHAYAHPEPEIAFTLAGQVDLAGIDLFAATVRRLWPLTRGDTVRIDASGLEFIGHEHLSLLDQCARADGRTVVLLTNQPSPARLVELLGFGSLRVQAVSQGDAIGRQLDARALVEHVQDVLMRSLELTPEQAFAALISLSHNAKLLDVVRAVHDELTSSAAKSRETVQSALENVRARMRPR